MSSLNFQPTIIIGAARSGTNMLRDVLTRLEGFGTWDCDEINPIWRHGNFHHPNDQFEADMARPEVVKFVRKEFSKIARSTKADRVVEKSCANTLRLPFIDQIFPEARYVHIYRDGRDTVASAKKRWNAPFELGYTLKKLRYVPLSDFPRIAGSFGMMRLRQLFGQQKKLAYWGVRLPMSDEELSNYTLDEICALQWDHSVRRSLEFFEQHPSQVHSVRYEEFVREPVEHMLEILRFLGVDHIDREAVVQAVGPVRTTSIHKYKKELSPDTIERVERIMAETLRKLDYEV